MIQFTMVRPSKTMAKVVGLVFRILVLLNCQLPTSIIFRTLQLMICCNGYWQFRTVIIWRTRPTTLAVIIKFNAARSSKALAKAVCLFLRVVVLSNCQLSKAIIYGMRQLIGGNWYWQFRRTRNPQNKTNTFSCCYLIIMAQSSKATAEVVGLVLRVSCPLKLSVLYVYHIRNAPIDWQ